MFDLRLNIGVALLVWTAGAIDCPRESPILEAIQAVQETFAENQRSRLHPHRQYDPDLLRTHESSLSFLLTRISLAHIVSSFRHRDVAIVNLLSWT